MFKKRKDKNETKELKISSFAKQIEILMWKNLIIFRRNIIGTLLEIICPFIFVSFLIIIRYFIERIKYRNYLNFPRNVLDLSPMTVEQKRNLVLYYPNNELIRGFVADAARLLSLNNAAFFPIGTLSLT